MEGLCKEKSVSLYIHIPYCTKKCSYCAFYSLPRSSWHKSPDEYSLLIMEEIREVMKSVPSFKTLYFGGGNPGLLSDRAIKRIVDEASKNEMPDEITIELNPEEVRKARIASLKSHVNRFSVGIQSLNEKALRLLGRNSTREENIKALTVFAESGVNYSADLITALPGTGVEETLEDINNVAGFNPGHISFYCLTYEENTELYKMRDKRCEDDEVLFLTSGWNELRRLGYEHYEVSNFARGGCQSMHNLNYWALGQYIGLGPGSESSLGYEDVYSYRVKEDLEAYFEKKEAVCEHLSKEEAALEYLMVSLRGKKGLDKKEMLKRFSIDFDSVFSSALKKLDSALYINTEERFFLKEKAWLILDSIILTLACAY